MFSNIKTAHLQRQQYQTRNDHQVLCLGMH